MTNFGDFANPLVNDFRVGLPKAGVQGAGFDVFPLALPHVVNVDGKESRARCQRGEQGGVACVHVLRRVGRRRANDSVAVRGVDGAGQERGVREGFQASTSGALQRITRPAIESHPIHQTQELPGSALRKDRQSSALLFQLAEVGTLGDTCQW